MDKKLCDFCNKEIKVDCNSRIEIKGKKKQTYRDVCEDCMIRINNAFNVIKTTKQPSGSGGNSFTDVIKRFDIKI